ncbi:MAG: TlpA family protein disulfide reductase [Pseudomonadales bacterium]|nr:TlpA family protein disulfide reductase [Pseudomonadales bacterium]
MEELPMTSTIPSISRSTLFLMTTLLLPLFLSLSFQAANAKDNKQVKEINNIASDFTLKRFQGPNTRLLDLRGRIVLLNFWASWCGPCRQEMPKLAKLQEKFPESEVMVIGINNDTNRREVEEFLHDTKITYAILFDPKQETSKKYKVKEMPSTFIIDRDGNIRHEHKGYQPGFALLYEQEIRELLTQ